uniref:Secreted protein n=1 Tax=Strongyloides stercoralis TaxID=6248 RepID=A0A0K0E2U0_STRER
MDFFNIFVLLFSIITISFESSADFKTFNCETNSTEPCIIVMDPLGSTYNSTLFELADPLTALSLDFGMAEYQRNKPKVVGILNEIIRDEVNQTVMENVVKYLNLTYRNPTYVVVNEDVNSVSTPPSIIFPETSTTKNTVRSTKSLRSPARISSKSRIKVTITPRYRITVPSKAKVTRKSILVTRRLTTRRTTYKPRSQYDDRQKNKIKEPSKLKTTTKVPQSTKSTPSRNRFGYKSILDFKSGIKGTVKTTKSHTDTINLPTTKPNNNLNKPINPTPKSKIPSRIPIKIGKQGL